MQVGKPYDRLAILGFALNRDWHDPRAWYCAELVAAALEYAGILRDGMLPTHKVTPVALAEIISLRPAVMWEEMSCPA